MSTNMNSPVYIWTGPSGENEPNIVSINEHDKMNGLEPGLELTEFGSQLAVFLFT